MREIEGEGVGAVRERGDGRERGEGDGGMKGEKGMRGGGGTTDERGGMGLVCLDKLGDMRPDEPKRT